MFEDSTFESNGRIRTRSRAWMFAALTFNSSILLALVLVPLIYPEALPTQASAFLMEAPPPPPAPPPPLERVQQAAPAARASWDPFAAPRIIPSIIVIPSTPEPPSIVSAVTWDPSPSAPGGNVDDLFRGQHGPIVHADVKAPIRVSSMVEAGLLIQKTMPVYPALGKEMRVEGTVVLTATVSKAGTIENLRVAGGPPILQQAALDAVKTWRYRPYLLNGQPVEVETSVNVIFTLQH